MDGLLRQAPVVIKEEGSGHDAHGWNGMWVFALVIIFLAVVFIAFRKDGGRDYHHGGMEGLVPFGAAALLNAEKRHGCGHYENCGHDRIWHDQAEEAGKTRYDMERGQREIERLVDHQSYDLEKSIGKVLEGQQKLAWDAERLFNIRTIDDKNDKLAELRLTLAEKEAKILHQETLNAICKSNGELNGKLDHIACHMQNQLTHLEDKMIKKPPFFAAGGVPFSSQCVPGVPFTG